MYFKIELVECLIDNMTNNAYTYYDNNHKHNLCLLWAMANDHKNINEKYRLQYNEIRTV